MVLKFCGLPVKSRFFLSPMANVTALPFRLMCRRMGAGLTITEQINATHIARNPDPFTNNEFFTIRTIDEEKPVGVQLFGAEEKDFATAVSLVEKNFEFININCGCPSERETSIGAGAALLKNPEKIVSIVKALNGVATKPITVKIRLGWSKNDSVKIAKEIEKANCAALMVHGRTAEQKYMGKADWDAIRLIRENVSIPVVANGDVNSAQSAKELLEKTGCDFGLVGRGAMQNPFIFREINELLENGVEWQPTDEERVNAFFDYYETTKNLGMVKFADLKLKAIQFTKGMEFAKKTRVSLVEAKTAEEIVVAVEAFREKVLA